MINLRVIGAVSLEQLLVLDQKRTRINPTIIPHQHNPSIGSQDAPEFGAAALAVKPMEGLPGGDKIHACFGQRGGFSSGGYTDEFRIGMEQLLAPFSHLPIGFDTEDFIPIRE